MEPVKPMEHGTGRTHGTMEHEPVEPMEPWHHCSYIINQCTTIPLMRYANERSHL